MRTTSGGMLVAACLCSVSLSHAAGENHFPSNEELRHIRAVAQPRLSPDARTVLVQIADSTADGAKTHIWLIDIEQNTARQLTRSPASDKRGENSAEWMPDGSSILFLAQRGERSQLFQLPMNGGEAHPFEVKILPPVDQSTGPGALPPADNKDAMKPAAEAKPEPVDSDVQHYYISPDGRSIALLIRDPETPGEKREHDERADAVWVGHNPHGSRLYLLDPASGRITPTAVPPDVQHIAWTRKGDRLLAVAEGMNNAGDLTPAASAWILSLSDPTHPMQLKLLPATIAAAAWSQDGSRIEYLAQSKADAPPGYEDLYEYVLADSSIHDLSDGFNGSLGHEQPIAEAAAVLAPVQHGTHTTYMRFTGNRRQSLEFATATVAQLNSNANQSGWVWLGTSTDQLPAVYFSEKLGAPARALKIPDLLPASWTQVRPQVVSWNSDSYTIEGLLYLPPQAAQSKVPLIVDVHGGPTGAFEETWSAFIEFLLGHGWAVLRTNPRGSTGYGASFAAANKNDLGGGDYRDIMAGLDYVLAHFPVDAAKLALMGYSYGGEMAGFVEGKTDRFKAVISGAPVIDQESEYGTEDSSWYDRWFYNGHPWEHAADAWRQSPLANAGLARTPFLLLQGESDRTDPVGQSEEMYRALRQMGVSVDLVEYPREDHGPLAAGIFGGPSPEPWHGFDARQRIVHFLESAFQK
jgi:dipeptidyl aminopeptidase/acylaminoacyl peptidase